LPRQKGTQEEAGEGRTWEPRTNKREKLKLRKREREAGVFCQKVESRRRGVAWKDCAVQEYKEKKKKN